MALSKIVLYRFNVNLN